MRRALPLLFALLALPVLGCPVNDAPKPKTVEDFGPPSSGDEPIPTAKAPDDPEDKRPEVTTSQGHKGGMVVLWPRVTAGADPAVAKDLAGRVQQKLEALAHRAGGARHVDVRPAPEVVCPKGGCIATMIGAIVIAKGDQCALLAYAAAPNRSPAHLLAWAGKVDMTTEIFPFTESPEALIRPKDFVPCAKLLEGRENEEAAIARYFVGILPGH